MQRLEEKSSVFDLNAVSNPYLFLILPVFSDISVTYGITPVPFIAACC
jgi:Mg2+/citrate symporter